MSSKHRFDIVVLINDEALAKHDGQNEAPPNDLKDWEMDDLLTAVEKGIVTRMDETEYIGPVK